MRRNSRKLEAAAVEDVAIRTRKDPRADSCPPTAERVEVSTREPESTAEPPTSEVISVREPRAGDEKLTATRRQLAQLQAQLADMQRDLAQEMQGRAEDADRIEALEGVEAKLRAELAEAATRAAETEAKLATVQGELATSQAALATARAEVRTRDEALAAAAEREQAVTDECVALRREIDRQAASRAEVAGELAAALGERDVARSEAERVTRELAEETEARRRLEAARETESAARAELERELAEVRAALAAKTDACEAHAARATEVASALASAEEHGRRLGQSLADVLAAEDAVAAARTRAREVLRGERGGKAPPPLPGRVAAAPSLHPVGDVELEDDVVELIVD